MKTLVASDDYPEEEPRYVEGLPVMFCTNQITVWTGTLTNPEATPTYWPESAD